MLAFMANVCAPTGAMVRLTIDAEVHFDPSARRLVRLEWRQKDERDQGPASPASTVETTTTLTRSAVERPAGLGDAAVAAVGKKRHELDGPIAFAAWLGVHALLMSGVRERVEAFIDWAWNYFSKSRAIQILDRADVSHIDWDKETESGESNDLSSSVGERIVH